MNWISWDYNTFSLNKELVLILNLEHNKMENFNEILLSIKKDIFDLKKQLNTPAPIYLNHKDGAELIQISPDELRRFFEQGLINRYPRKGEGFRYKIKELLVLADAIDRGEIKIIPNYNK